MNIDLSQLITAKDNLERDAARLRDGVKKEASRRIVAICPEWKQLNLTAQTSILVKKGVANWTAEDAATWAKSEQIWSQIAAVRAASDRLEDMNPLPSNYTDDDYWP